MILKLLLGAAILIAAFSFIHKYKKAHPDQKRAWIIKAVIAVVLVAIILGTLTGRVPIVAGLVAAGATLFKLGLRWGFPLAKVWFAKTGGNATFRSRYLIMSVSVGNGQMTGEIIHGEFEGRSLGSLSNEELQRLLAFLGAEDKKSYYLLSAYIRSKGFTQHSDAGRQSTPPPSQQTSLEEAMEILGFKEMPTKQEVISAHRRLMSKIHPDKGGSDYLAARVNQAREVLIKVIDRK